MESPKNVRLNNPIQAKSQSVGDLMSHILDINLDAVREELLRKKIFYQPEAACAISEYRKYLFLLGHDLLLNSRGIQKASVIIAPDEVAEVWHTHIHTTKPYREDCDRVFGQFIDHGFSPAPGTSEYQMGVENFTRLYRSLRFSGRLPKCLTFTGNPTTREEYRHAHRRNR